MQSPTDSESSETTIELGSLHDHFEPLLGPPPATQDHVENNNATTKMPDLLVKRDYRTLRLKYAIVFCMFLFLLQFIGGWISSSLALMADAFHMLSDVFGYCISLLSIIVAKAPRTQRLPYGKKRVEVLGALASIALLWILSLGLAAEAVERLYNPRVIEAKTMMGMAVCGVVVNCMLIGIFGHEMDHEEEEGARERSRDEEVASRTSLDSLKERGASFELVSLDARSNELDSASADHHTKTDINIRAAMLHAIGDLLCSVGVVIAAITIYFRPSWQWIDPLCTLFFAAVALFTTLSVLKDIYGVLVQASPPDFDHDEITLLILSIQGVISVEQVSVWALTQKDLVASVKVTLSVSVPGQVEGIITEIKRLLRGKGIDDSTVETRIQRHSQC